MSDPTSIFNNDQNTSTQTQDKSTNSNGTTVQPDNTLATMLQEIKNERGEQKYKDPLEAIKALQHSQAFIPELKVQLQEKERLLAEAQAKAQRAEELERTIAELTKVKEQTTTTAPVIDESKIADLVKQTINQSREQETQANNLKSVVQTLQSVFGADAEKTFYSKASELGMSVEEVNRLAATKPKAVLTMLGVKENPTQKVDTSHTNTSVNTSAFQQDRKSAIGRSQKSVLIGATTQDVKESFNDAKAMVDELHAQGLSVHDLTDPKVYAKYFK